MARYKRYKRLLEVAIAKMLTVLLGEPVGCLIIPSHLFVCNKQNYPVLTRAHEILILRFKEIINNIAIMVKCNNEDERLRYYSNYLRNLLTNNPITDPMYG